MKKLYQQVKEGKSAEAKLGCDGALVAHPYMAPACKEVFDAALGNDVANGIDKLKVCAHTTHAQYTRAQYTRTHTVWQGRIN
jgi:malate synthase